MADSASSGARQVGGVRRRNVGGSRAGPSAGPAAAPRGGNSGMMRIYYDDSPGIKVDPVVVLVFSLAFIASVFLLHIIGKWTKS